MRGGKSWPWIIPIFAQTLWAFSGRQLLRGDFLRCESFIFHGSLRRMVIVFISVVAAALAVAPQSTGTNVVPAPVPAKNNPLDKEYRKLLEMDDASQAEVDTLI